MSRSEQTQPHQQADLTALAGEDEALQSRAEQQCDSAADEQPLLSPQDFYRGFTGRDDVREILKRLAQS